ncbi:hypothetical protein HDV00_012496, partial [Rhizophlyctis rosea]
EELGLDSTFTPVLYRAATLAFKADEVAIVTPLEMARKRLQVQKVGGSRAARRANRRRRAEEGSGEGEKEGVEPAVEEVQTFETVVQTSGKMYAGILDCIGSIIAEEGGKSKKGRRKKRKATVGTGPAGVGAAGAAGGVAGPFGISWVGGGLGFGGESYGGNEWQKVWGGAEATGAAPPGLQPYPTYSAAMPVPVEPTPQRRGDQGGGVVGAVGRFASGVKTLYRGFWPRYISRIVVYAFEEISSGDEW